MSADGLVPTFLLSLVSVFAGLWARQLATKLADLSKELRRLSEKYEADAREIAAHVARTEETDRAHDRRLERLEAVRA